MDRSWMPTVAGVLEIIAGVFSLLGFGALIFAVSMVGFAAAEEGPDFPLVAVQALLGFIAFGILALALLALIGGVFSLLGRRWGWAVAGAIAATVTCPPLGVPAVILTVLSEKELRKIPT